MADNSVLLTIKKMIGPSELYEGFDTDLLVHLNSTLASLSQMGVVAQGTKVVDENTTWNDLIGDAQDIESIKSYMYLKTRILFDPPANATILNAYQAEIKEFEWRMYVATDKDDSSTE